MKSRCVFSMLSVLGRSNWYWIVLVLIGISSEVIALYYQHVLDELPCILCIHVRLYVLGFILVALFALCFHRIERLLLLAHVLTTVLMAGFLERSYLLLGTERGWLVSSCDYSLGLPEWFALEEWVPSAFKVMNSCGYTPELWFGVTMAEALVILSSGLLLLSFVLTLSMFFSKKFESAL